MIKGINETNAAKVEAIAADMLARGWVGFPLLAIETWDGLQALTGSHRIAAAELAGIEPPVEVVPDIPEHADLLFALAQSLDDDDRLEILQGLADADRAFAVALEIMAAEVAAN